LDGLLLSEARISPYFPLSLWSAGVDDRRLCDPQRIKWKDAPKEYGPHKTLYNRYICWSRMGVFDRIFAALASEGPEPKRIMIDATHLNVHRTAASLLKKGLQDKSLDA
jgi:hypothetical protein